MGDGGTAPRILNFGMRVRKRQASRTDCPVKAGYLFIHTVRLAAGLHLVSVPIHAVPRSRAITPLPQYVTVVCCLIN
jgi:hypothetical protein